MCWGGVKRDCRAKGLKNPLVCLTIFFGLTAHRKKTGHCSLKLSMIILGIIAKFGKISQTNVRKLFFLSRNLQGISVRQYFNCRSLLRSFFTIEIALCDRHLVKRSQDDRDYKIQNRDHKNRDLFIDHKCCQYFKIMPLSLEYFCVL